MTSILRASSPRRLPSGSLDVPWTVAEALFVAAVAVGFQFGVVFFAQHLVPFWPDSAHFLELAAHGDALTKIVLYLFYFAPGLGAIGWVLKNYGARWRDVGWRAVSGVGFAETAVYLVATFVAFAVGSGAALHVVSLTSPAFQLTPAQSSFFVQVAGHQQVVAFATLVVLPPLVEESVFRGFLFPALAKKWGLIGGAVGSSVMFGVVHGQVALALDTFILGIVLCLLYARVKSIFPGMAIHMLNNALAFAALMHR